MNKTKKKQKLRKFSNRMRVLHRYLGYFMAGILTIYSFTGITLLCRNSHFLKKSVPVAVRLEKNLSKAGLIKAVAENKTLHLRDFKIIEERNGLIFFDKNRYNEEGTYNIATGELKYVGKEYPAFVDKLISLHKAKIEDPLSAFNLFFALTLFFFVFSSFWMFKPKNPVFRKGMKYVAGGAVLAAILLFFL